jgi:hypothetical protein
MLHIPAAIVPARAARCLMPVRCWRIDTQSPVAGIGPWRLTDCQHAIEIHEEDRSRQVYTPTQIVFPQTSERSTGMRSNTSELHVGIDENSPIDESVIGRGLLDGARVTMFEVDGTRPWIRLRMFRWFVARVKNGKGQAIIELSGVSSKLQNTVGESITTTCQNQFGDALCATGGVINSNPDFGFRSYEVGVAPVGVNLRRTMRIREAVDTFPADAKVPRLEGDDPWWAFGRIRFTSGANEGVEAWIESNAEPINAGTNWVVDIVLTTPLEFLPETGDTVQMRVGCSRTDRVVEDLSSPTKRRRIWACKDKFNNVASFRGFTYLPGSDTQQVTPGAS